MTVPDNPVLTQQLTELCDLVDDRSWCVIDIETTGPDPSRGDRVIEVGAVCFDDKWCELVRPDEEGAYLLLESPFPDEATEGQITVLLNELVRQPLSHSNACVIREAGVPECYVTAFVSPFRKTRLKAVSTAMPKSVARAAISALCGDVPKGVNASVLCGITSEDLRQADTFDGPCGAGERLAETLGGKRAVFFGAEFDAGFLAAEYCRYGMRVPSALYDPICLRKLVDGIQWPLISSAGRRPPLSEICDVLGINLSSAHNALSDAEATAELMAAVCSYHRANATMNPGE